MIPTAGLSTRVHYQKLPARVLEMEIWKRCNTIEECYEFMLAYAAQGLPSDAGSRSGGQVRAFLQRAVTALTGLAESCATEVQHAGLEPAERYQAFFAVLDRDA